MGWEGPGPSSSRCSRTRSSRTPGWPLASASASPRSPVVACPSSPAGRARPRDQSALPPEPRDSPAVCGWHPQLHLPPLSARLVAQESSTALLSCTSTPCCCRLQSPCHALSSAHGSLLPVEQPPQHLHWPSDPREGIEHLGRAQALGVSQSHGGQHAALSRDTLPLVRFPLLQRTTPEMRRRPRRACKHQRHSLSSLANVALVRRATRRRAARVVQQLAIDREV